jgi:ElaB/YqjD/DUF883 family membrane-anchored ribosome-binding protein
MLKELRALVEEAERMLGAAPAEDGETICDALRERFEAAQARFGETCQDARKKVVAGARQADQIIRDNPYQSIAIALGLGVLAGLLLGRRAK